MPSQIQYRENLGQTSDDYPIYRQNLGRSAKSNIPDRLGFFRHMKTSLKVALPFSELKTGWAPAGWATWLVYRLQYLYTLICYGRSLPWTTLLVVLYAHKGISDSRASVKEKLSVYTERCLVPRRRSLVERDALWLMGLIVRGSQGVMGFMQTKSRTPLPAVLPDHHPSRSLFSRHTAFDRTAPGDEAAQDAFRLWCMPNDRHIYATQKLCLKSVNLHNLCCIFCYTGKKMIKQQQQKQYQNARLEAFFYCKHSLVWC